MIDGLYAHLLLNHIPVIGTVIALPLLIAAFLRRSNELARAALVLLVAMSIVGAVVFYTGEPAEDRVEKLPGFSKEVIHEHEEAGEKAMFAIPALGVVSLGGLLAYRKRPELPRWFVALVLAIALATLGLTAWTAQLGGKIRHTELEAAPAPQQP